MVTPASATVAQSVACGVGTARVRCSGRRLARLAPAPWAGLRPLSWPSQWLTLLVTHVLYPCVLFASAPQSMHVPRVTYLEIWRAGDLRSKEKNHSASRRQAGQRVVPTCTAAVDGIYLRTTGSRHPPLGLGARLCVWTRVSRLASRLTWKPPHPQKLIRARGRTKDRKQTL
jgi:hypothetical protein